MVLPLSYRIVTKTEVGTKDCDIAMTDLTVLLFRGMCALD